MINLLQELGVGSERRTGAPGIYVHERKIAALGLRIRNGRCFHGLSLNVDMDLAPFHDIDTCGFPDLDVTSLQRLGVDADRSVIDDGMVRHLTIQLTQH